MQGVCQQRHFPAVAQPFRVLWAPWAPALFFFFCGLFFSVLCAAIFGAGIGGFMLPVGIVGGHTLAILVGLRMQFMANIIGGLENRRTGSTNLAAEKTSQFDFANL